MPTLRNFLEKININAAIAYEEPMSAHTTFRIGGPAEAFVSPRDREACLRLLREARAAGLPLFALGGGANILVGDRGIRGIVLDTSLMSAIRVVEGDPGVGRDAVRDDGPDRLHRETLLVAEAGASVDALCEAALERGLAGLENFYGMPGSLGGAVYMNARCYEVEMAERLAWVEAARPEAGAAVERRPCEAGQWAYKRSPYQAGGPAAGALILAAAFRLGPGERAAIEATMRERRADREAKGHYRLPSAGSVFKNDRALGRPTGKILDELGFRGRRIGDAAVSDWHANIFVNAGKASAADMRALIECAQREVRERLGVGIEAEVVFAGDF